MSYVCLQGSFVDGLVEQWRLGCRLAVKWRSRIDVEIARDPIAFRVGRVGRARGREDL